MSTLIIRLDAFWQRAVALLEALQPLALLAARVYVFQVFFFSGLLKVQHWDTTLSLFSDYYQVPLLPPTLAAVMGAAGELVFSSLLLAGLAGRFAALGLFVVNLFAFLSLPEADLSDPIRMQHAFWGSLLTVLALWGPGPLSADRLIGWWRTRRPAFASQRA
jgi:putative oxidoreductase